MKAITFTTTTLFQFSGLNLPSEWFIDYHLPVEAQGIKRVVVGEIVYFIEETLDSDDGVIIVINLSGESPVFGEDEQLSEVALDRIITVAKSLYTTCVLIPHHWRAFRSAGRSLCSIYAAPKSKGQGSRLNFDTRPNAQDAMYVFAHTETTVKLENIDCQYDIYEAARTCLQDAILYEEPKIVKSGSDRNDVVILPDTSKLQVFTPGSTLEQCYEFKLTTEQRNFVDQPHGGLVRLRGSAGTGKTFSLIIKTLIDGNKAEANQKRTRFGLITHSVASVEMVNAIAMSLDAQGLMSGQGKYCTIELRTLYDLAYKGLSLDSDELEPLSLDGRDGRNLQFFVIQDVLREMKKSATEKIRYSSLDKIDERLLDRWLSDDVEEESKFIIELMNEFASLLDGEGIRAYETKGEDYAKGTIKRMNWLMALPSERDRRFILEIHRRYHDNLSTQKIISVDQMVADFNAHLDSNMWHNKRDRNGYDAIFVDELHLFTPVERETLRKLIIPSFENTSDGKERLANPSIFMAYDLKQSPNDVFASMLEGNKSKWFTSKSGLSGSKLVELKNVFRYTPEISEFLRDLDAAFPHLDMPDEWALYGGESQIESGTLPELTVYTDERSLFLDVMNKAKDIAQSGRKVAVLCVSEEMFGAHLEEAQLLPKGFKKSFFPVDSRESSSGIRRIKKRFVFSMPEYVAGLQFDTVFLIHVNVTDAPKDSSLSLRRRFISNIYLGASRAEQFLYISSCSTRGGVSDILGGAIQRNSLKQI